MRPRSCGRFHAADCYRSDAERRYVVKRLAEITDELRARRDLGRVA